MLAPETIAFNYGGDARFFQSGMGAWISENPAFEAFVEEYRVKITAKVRACRNEDQLRDLFWELQLAHLLLQSPDFRIAYEPYGTNQSRAPDYRVITTFSATFNVEATRIAKGALQTRFARWENDIKQSIRATPSDVGIALDIGSFEADLSLLDEIESNRDAIKAAIVTLLFQADVDLRPGETLRHLVPGFEGLIELEISKPQRQSKPNQTSYYGCSSPVWYTQKEFRKLGDIICDKLGQCRPGMANILAIRSSSVTHEEVDFSDAIGEIMRLATLGDDRFFQAKGFDGSLDFLTQYKRLSAIVLRTDWIDEHDRNFLWFNHRAETPLNNRIVQCLENLD